ncbi:MAG: asparagine--tRNA ligase [Candidatus Latescibacteria bacterium]|nr:asparagine--tRNA ligase [Candidatus Latescibacterota bacterium]
MENVAICDISQYEGREARIQGWLYQKRSSGKLHFLQVRDGTGSIQCIVAKGEVSETVFQQAAHIGQESSLIVEGVVRVDSRSPIGYEIGVHNITVLQDAEGYPIGPKEHGVGFLMEHRHLWLRSSRQHAILRVRSELIKACRDYLDDQRFTLIDAPIFTPAACEGTTTLFAVDYFGEKAYLTQSGQLYLEAAAMAFGRVYCFGPTFRAEKSKTRRHLTEFWMLEPEMAYADLDDDMALAEGLIEYVVQRVLETRSMELQTLGRDLDRLKQVERPFPRICYDEAITLLQKKGVVIEWGQDFGGDEETILAESFEKPVMVHRYPAECKAFYMKNDPEDTRLALCVDLLAPEGYGEIIGGGQREDDLSALLQKIETHHLPQEPFEWYLDLRRYGTVPHAGFGLGVERTLAWMCGLPHVRETIPFPRMLERMYP